MLSSHYLRQALPLLFALAAALLDCHHVGRSGPASAPANASSAPADVAVQDAAASVLHVASFAVPTDAARLTGDDRRAQVVAIVERHQDVASCWNDALERDSGHAAENFHVQLAVSAEGRGRVTLDGASDADLIECVRVRLEGHSYEYGEAMSTTLDYELAPGS